MLVIRGINVYPSALENLIRSFPEVEEFEVEVLHERNMAELLIRIELNNGDGETVAVALRDHVHQKLSLRPKVETVSKLPRYELKARRFKF
jgi:phenylacetate-CoA ligase